jgi:response regulator RpfG family c-di-GMP phosphodiesterase
MQEHENKLIAEIEVLKENFAKTTDNLIKDVRRQDKIMARSDKRQQQEYDELQRKFDEVAALQKEIEETQREVVFTMGAIGESRSKETGNHVKRVAEYSKVFALHYGLDEREAEMLKQASPMHDIGKVAIPDAVLNKPGRFDEHERKIMDTHAELGYEMLKMSNRPLLRMAATVAYEHHEKWNGTGYPNKLKGEEIHIYGRITALADVFDALGSDRCYKKAWDDEKIFNLFKEERGEHFDPKLVDIFFEHLDEFLAIRDKFKDVIQ